MVQIIRSIVFWFAAPYHNGTLVSVSLVEGLELLEGEVADNITVEDKEGRVVLAENIASKGEGTGCQKGGESGLVTAKSLLFVSYVALALCVSPLCH